MGKVIRIGTRESQLAVWQATLVQQLLAANNYPSELVYIKSEGDVDLQTPLYEMGVQGIFTRSLDIALLTGKIEIAVHSMKDVPTQLPAGIVQAAVLKRASYKDIFVFKDPTLVASWQLDQETVTAGAEVANGIIATSSIRRKAQWLHRYPGHTLENLRGNVNTRLRKVQENNWHGAIFAAAGLERIQLRPTNAIDLHWMLPAPAQGAIMVVARAEDGYCLDACQYFNHDATALCTKIERDFLKTLLGGCSTPISALAEIKDGNIHLRGNIFSVDGRQKMEMEKLVPMEDSANIGNIAAKEMLQQGADQIVGNIANAR